VDHCIGGADALKEWPKKTGEEHVGTRQNSSTPPSGTAICMTQTKPVMPNTYEKYSVEQLLCQSRATLTPRLLANASI
jgi:hypothetical protein